MTEAVKAISQQLRIRKHMDFQTHKRWLEMDLEMLYILQPTTSILPAGLTELLYLMVQTMLKVLEF